MLKPDNSNVVVEIIDTNDNQSITDELRKSKLTKLFAELDTEVVFVP